MPSLTLKNVPADLYRRLKKTAAENHRSLNREAILRLERSIGMVDWEEFRNRVDRVRESLSMPYLTDEDINAAKRAGRP